MITRILHINLFIWLYKYPLNGEQYCKKLLYPDCTKTASSSYFSAREKHTFQSHFPDSRNKSRIIVNDSPREKWRACLPCGCYKTVSHYNNYLLRVTFACSDNRYRRSWNHGYYIQLHSIIRRNSSNATSVSNFDTLNGIRISGKIKCKQLFLNILRIAVDIFGVSLSCFCVRVCVTVFFFCSYIG